MKRVLVVGIDSIVGGNLAMGLSQHHQVVGLFSTSQVEIAGCHVQAGVPQTPEGIHRELARTSPDLVVVSGPAARSIWSLGNRGKVDSREFQSAANWARAVAKTKSRLIVISSDAVFHGPWMFHEEQCTGVCLSPAAVAIRDMETQVLQTCPQALIARTNVFGWSPQAEGGWLETLVEQISDETPVRVPSGNYATPIEASRLAEILNQAWDRGLEGVYHMGGSERVNFVHFAHRLAQEFQLPRPRFQPTRQPEAAHVFGQGETSLHSGKVRRAIGTPLPMLGESLKRLREQFETNKHLALREESRELVANAA
jgi:dTDP-4-dehydrorhamnose reductase